MLRRIPWWAGPATRQWSAARGPRFTASSTGYAGGSEAIFGLKANDVLVFGGYATYPILSEGVVNGSDEIRLVDGTLITLVGFNHKVF
jgi:hypothetical protein